MMMMTSLNKYNGALESSEMGHYEVYIVSPLLREELGIALIDSGSMVSRVKESLVTRFRMQEWKIKLQGIARK
jgi:hypothetical protein